MVPRFLARVHSAHKIVLVPRSMGFPGSFPIAGVSAMHIIQASFFAAVATSGGATCLAAVAWGFGSVGLPNGNGFISFCMILSALLAIFGIFVDIDDKRRLFFFLPQHFLLGVMMLGGLYSAKQGMYLDGGIRPWEFILVDQISFVLLFVIHSRAILHRSHSVIYTRMARE